MDGPEHGYSSFENNESQQHNRRKMLELRSYGSSVEAGNIVPHYIANSLRDVDFEMLFNKYGTRIALLDLDNTLTQRGKNTLYDPEIAPYLQGLQEKGILGRIYLTTKSRRDTREIERAIGATRFTHPKGLEKPNPDYFKAVLEEAGYTPEKGVMIGDRLTHDIDGANAAGLVTVYVRPIQEGFLGVKSYVPRDYIDNTYLKEKRALKSIRAKLREIDQKD